MRFLPGFGRSTQAERLPSGSRLCTMVVIDRSGSMSRQDYVPTRLAGAIKAAQALIDEKRAKRPNDVVAIVGFNKVGKIYADPSSVNVCFNRAFDQLTATGNTRFQQGLKSAQSAYQRLNDRSYQPQIIFLSDGQDGDKGSFAFSQHLKHQHYDIHTIGVGQRASVDEERLKKIASIGPNGPQYQFIDNVRDLVIGFKKLAALRMVTNPGDINHV